MSSDPRPIGAFDSGVGGLSVLREVHQRLPGEDVLYVADQAHVPYGPRPADEITAFAFGITRWLLEQDVKAVLIPCNTASVALPDLRAAFPEVSFVGMEPAVKPAAHHSTSGVIGVLATEGTFKGALYAGVVERYAKGVQVIMQTCPAFVTLVEAGQLEGAAVEAEVARHVAPLRQAGADQIVLGCTHFPFLAALIAEAAGPQAAVIDPSAAVARQLGRVITPSGRAAGQTHYFTTGDAQAFHQLAERLLSTTIPQENIKELAWQGDHLRASS